MVYDYYYYFVHSEQALNIPDPSVCLSVPCLYSVVRTQKRKRQKIQICRKQLLRLCHFEVNRSNNARAPVCTHQAAALLCLKWHYGRHLESLTWNRKSDSVIRCIIQVKNICQISSRSDLKRWNAFWKGRPNMTNLLVGATSSKKNTNNKNKMISDMRSVADLKPRSPNMTKLRHLRRLNCWTKRNIQSIV